MNHRRITTFFTIAFAILILSACSIMKPHQNEKIIVGTWIPVSVEKVIDSTAMMAAGQAKGDTLARKSKTGMPAGDGGAAKKEAAYDRLVQAESRATLEIMADHTAIKKFPGTPLNATWKMKGKGTRIVAKNVENKMKFTIDIIEISPDQIVIIEHAPVGDVKITYKRQM